MSKPLVYWHITQSGWVSIYDRGSVSQFARLGMQPHTGRWCIKYIPYMHGLCQLGLVPQMICQVMQRNWLIIT